MPEPLLTRIAVRGHAQPELFRPKRRRSTRAGFPPEALVLTTVRSPCPGEPVQLAAVADLMGDQGPLMPAQFVMPRGSPIDPADLSEMTGADPLDHAGLLRLLYKRPYKERSCLVGMHLPRHLSALAADWAPSGKDGVGLIMWTRPCPERRSAAEKRRRPLLANGEIEDGYRPRIRLHPMGGERARITFQGRGAPDLVDRIPEGSTRPDPKYRFPGYLLDLATATYATTGTMPTGLRDAGGLFGLDLRDAPVGPGSLSAPLITLVCRELEDTARLYHAILLAHRARTHDA
jgi:hypothetical protein